MTAPILELRADCLKKPGRLDIAVVEAMMLWPDDDAARYNAFRAAVTKEGKQFIGDQNREELEEYAHFAAATAGLHPSQEDVMKRLDDGSIAGRMLFEAVAAHDARRALTLNEIRNNLCRDLKPEHQMEPKTIQNHIWPMFKPVAHFWAAYHGRQTATGHFPCRRVELGEFLGLANFYLEQGLIAKAPRASHPVLLPGEAVIIPDAIHAPNVHPKFVWASAN